MILVYIEFLIDTGLSKELHEAQEWTLSQRESCGSSGWISHPLLMGPERKEMWMMEWNVIFEGWGIGHWRGSGYGKGLVWEDSPHHSLFCLLWALLPWWQHMRMEESQDSWDGGDSCRPLYLCRDIKAKKSRGVPQVAESVYSNLIKKKKKEKHSIYKTSQWRTLSGICGNPWSPSYIFYYGPSSNVNQQIPKIIKWRRTDACGWREEQGLECPWWPRE